MPYLMRECETQESIKLEGVQPPPFGPGFTEEQLTRAKKLVVTGSSFSDPGGDWVRFELHDESGRVFATRTISGY